MMSNKDGGDNHPGVRGGGPFTGPGQCFWGRVWSDRMFGEQLGNLWVREGCAAATFALQSWLPKTEETDRNTWLLLMNYESNTH